MAAVTPAPGKLPVEYDNGLGPISKPLDQIRERTFVSATGTITRIASSGPASAVRATIVVTGPAGDTAYCSLDGDTRRNYNASLREGARVMVRGTVRYLPDNRPVIDALAVHDLDRQITAL
ncbi:hypothetical protein AB0M05_40970 [Streptomyces violaceusniger]|uniref:hypothetical protein n=1 Tax=Streptomyces violaceusniger TaxID=68280 RepID=UPI003446730F